MKQHTAALLLIGDELLSGKIADTNTHFLTRELFARGIKVRRVTLVPDELDEVVQAIHDLRQRADYVFTSGGIGPTHDDITVEAVAKALDRPLFLDHNLEKRAMTIFGEKLNAAHLKMATIPEGTTLVESEETRWPALAVDNVFVLAGVPQIFRRAFRAIAPMLPSGASRSVVAAYVLTDEWSMASRLDEIVAAFPDVQLGSYPVIDDPEYRVKLTLESTDPARVEEALAALLKCLPEHDLVRIERY